MNSQERIGKLHKEIEGLWHGASSSYGAAMLYRELLGSIEAFWSRQKIEKIEQMADIGKVNEMNDEQSFEDWVKNGWCMDKLNGKYVDARTYGAWEVWKLFDKETKERIQVAVDAEQELCVKFLDGVSLDKHCCVATLEHCRNMIRAGEHREKKVTTPDEKLEAIRGFVVDEHKVWFPTNVDAAGMCNRVLDFIDKL